MHGKGKTALVEAELSRISEEVRVSEEMKILAAQDGPPHLQCFKGSNTKRTLIACLPAAAQQLIGAAFVLGKIFSSLKESSLTKNRLYHIFHVVAGCHRLLHCVCRPLCCNADQQHRCFLLHRASRPTMDLVLRDGSSYHDRANHGNHGLHSKSRVLVGYSSLHFSLVSASVPPRHSSVYNLFRAIAYQLSIGAIGFALASEVPTPRLRAPTLSLVGITQGAFGWLIGFISPYMINPDQGNLGAKVGFVFFGLGVPLSIAIWFFVPETRGLSFDDVCVFLFFVVPQLIIGRWIIYSTTRVILVIFREILQLIAVTLQQSKTTATRKQVRRSKK